jgi:hypothetical protein
MSSSSAEVQEQTNLCNDYFHFIPSMSQDSINSANVKYQLAFLLN